MSDETVDFWSGEFGDGYIARNPVWDRDIRARTMLWAEILKHIAPEKPRSIMEIGASVGNNLRALRSLSGADFYAVEPNETALKILVDDGVVHELNARRGTAVQRNFPPNNFVEMVFTCGVLIHIPPEELLESCRSIHSAASRWIVAIEYFSAAPREVPYRNYHDKLWTRDFGAFYLDHFPDLKPVACGFAWKRLTGLDNVTYWIFKKR